MIEFMKEFIKNPRTVGAIAPSGRALMKGMLDTVDFTKAKTIVEFGPGTGAFTREIIRRKQGDCRLLLIEKNENFYKMLEKEYRNRNDIIVVNGDAQDIERYLEVYEFETLDYIVSGLPFTSLPKEVSHNILMATSDVLKKQGTFITFQYSKVKMKLFQKYFSIKNRKRVYLNFPPAYVFECEGGES